MSDKKRKERRGEWRKKKEEVMEMQTN